MDTNAPIRTKNHLKKRPFSRPQTTTGLIVVALFIALASIYPFYIAYTSEVAMTRRFVTERAQTVLLSLKAGILAHGRMGRYHADKLTAIFEDLAADQHVLALQLISPAGKVIVRCGNPLSIPSQVLSSPFSFFSETTYAATMALDLLGSCNPNAAHRGRGAWAEFDEQTPFEAGAYLLTTVLDATDVKHAIHRHQLHLILSIVAIFAAWSLAVFTFRLLSKRETLAAELERQREETRRHEQVAQLGAGLAHETKNPLGIIRGLAQSIGNCTKHTCPIKNRAKDIVDEVDRVVGVINSFLTLARPPDVAPRALNLDAFFGEFLPIVQMDATAANVEIVYHPCHAWILADENLLRRALLNVLLNAIRASKPGQPISISCSQQDTEFGITIEDKGCGISSDDLTHIAEPYFTRFKGGVGLGLSIVDNIASAHQWQLTFDSVLGQGTRVHLDHIQIAPHP